MPRSRAQKKTEFSFIVKTPKGRSKGRAVMEKREGRFSEVTIAPRRSLPFGGTLETSMYKSVCFTLANTLLDVSSISHLDANHREVPISLLNTRSLATPHLCHPRPELHPCSSRYSPIRILAHLRSLSLRLPQITPVFTSHESRTDNEITWQG